MTETLPTYIARESEATTLPVVSPVKLGVHCAGDGVDVAVIAGSATAVDFCVFSDDGDERRYALSRATQGAWQGHVPNVGVGARYGFRVDGHWDPASGQRFNPAKVLLDPYARGIAAPPTLHPALYAHEVGEDLLPLGEELTISDLDSADVAALGVVVDNSFPVPISHPYTPWNRTVIYELHVQGFTKNFTDIPPELRGTYAGLAHPATIKYLKSLGVTAVELLPIHAKMDEPFLKNKGLENYWGYNTLSFFSPEPSYATAKAQREGATAVLNEVKGMVALLHEAGIEVILDVVYNHTCEGGYDGPSVSWRGLDNAGYYIHTPTMPAKMMDTTGCGNSLDFRHTEVIKMTLDSLRYWVEKVGVDGFRFDLAVTLGRNGETFDPHHPVLVAMVTDPVLCEVKLITEPWDLGPGGWQTGNFPAPMADWNDHFRDTMRQFWLSDAAALHNGGHGGDLRDLATRACGSQDLFGHGRLIGGRGMHSSINFVTAHDGFTLRDLTTYNEKHNEANLEDNRDGTTHNISWNHGFEGELPDSHQHKDEIDTWRRRSIRNLLGSLILAAGTPMLTAGDEIGKTQQGNNNAYCQNSDISWIDWNLEEWQTNLRDTVAYLLRLRRNHSVLRPETYYTGNVLPGDSIRDVEWFDVSGQRMPTYRWFDTHLRVVQMLRSGQGRDVDALAVANGSLRVVDVTLPTGRNKNYTLVWDSSWESIEGGGQFRPGEKVTLAPLTFQLYFVNPK